MKIQPGFVFRNKQGSECIVIDYKGAHDITIEFMDRHKYRMKTQSSHLRRGAFKNPFHPAVEGVGYVGVGAFSVSKGGKQTYTYSVWINILKRCYNPNHPQTDGYKDCIIHDDWLNFQNFAQWHSQQKGFDLKWDVDKDLLIKGNRIYSADTCRLVPREINSLFPSTKRSSDNLPVGVSKNCNRYQARLGVKGKRVLLGTYDSPEQAFSAYKQAKETHIRNMVERKYAHMLSDDLKESLLNYRVQTNGE